MQLTNVFHVSPTQNPTCKCISLGRSLIEIQSHLFRFCSPVCSLRIGLDRCQPTKGTPVDTSRHALGGVGRTTKKPTIPKHFEPKDLRDVRQGDLALRRFRAPLRCEVGKRERDDRVSGGPQQFVVEATWGEGCGWL